MTNPDTTAPGSILPGMLRVHRGQLVAVAVIGLVLGIVAILFPGASLLTVAIVFGIYLIASGLFRITVAFVADGLGTSMRWLSGLLGLLIMVAGVICLSNPFQSLVVLAIVIGAGWILEGIVDLAGGVRGTIHPRWFGWVSGIVSIAAGVAMFVLPAAGVLALVSIGGILLIVVSATTLLTLPSKSKTAA